MNTRQATTRRAHPRVAIFTNLLPVQRDKHERMLRGMGFDPVTKEFPRAEPKFAVGEYAAIVVVQEHCDTPGDPLRVQLGAKKAGLRCFGVTKKEAGAGWNNFRTWAEGLGLTPMLEDDPPETEKAPESEKAPAPLVHVIVPPPEDRMRREAETWQQLATESDEKLVLSEKELKLARDHIRELEGELKTAINVRDAARRNAGVFKADLDKASLEEGKIRKLLDEVTGARDSVMKRFHDAQAELKTAREELHLLRSQPGASAAEVEDLKKQLHSKQVMLTKAREERDEARETIRMAQAPVAKKIAEVSEQLWKLVENEVLDAEDAFQKLVEFAKGGSDG